MAFFRPRVGEGGDPTAFMTSVVVPAVPEDIADLLEGILREEGLPALIDRSAVGDARGHVEALVAFAESGRLAGSPRPPGAVVETWEDLAPRLEASGVTSYLLNDLPGPGADLDEPGSSLATGGSVFSAATDAVTALRADDVLLAALACGDGTELRVTDSDAATPLDWRLIRRAAPGVHGPVSSAAFVEGAVTFVRLADRRGFVIGAGARSIAGIWDRNIVILDPGSSAVPGESTTLAGQMLEVMVAPDTLWDDAVNRLVKDPAAAERLRILLRETGSRSDSFFRLASVFEVPHVAAEMAEAGDEPEGEYRVAPQTVVRTFRDEFRREWNGSAPITRENWWLSLSARHPSLRWTFTAVGGALGVAGIIAATSRGAGWPGYLIPCFLLVVVVVDALTPRRRAVAGPECPAGESQREGDEP